MAWRWYAFNLLRRSLAQHPRMYAGAASAPLLFYLNHDNLFSFQQRADECSRIHRPIYLWGNNLYGIVDPSTYGKEPAVKYPRQVGCWQGAHLRAVALGTRHAAAVDGDGNVYQWGEAFWQRSGIFGTFGPVCTLKGRNCRDVVVNEGGAYVIDGEGRVVVLGLNAAEPSQTVAVGERVVEIKAGRAHLVALGQEGTVFTGATNHYGNVFGQLGRGPTDSTRRALDSVQQPPLLPEAISSVVQGWPRSETAIEQDALSVDPSETPCDTLFPDISLHPVDSKWWEGDRAVQVAAGDCHSLVRTERGHVYGFGSNEMLQLGIGQYDPSRSINPYPQPVLTHSFISFIACGAATSYFVADGERETSVFAAGFGQYGQLGNKSWTHAQGTPVRVQTISGLTYYDEAAHMTAPIRCRYIAAGGDHAAAVMNTVVPGTLPSRTRSGYDVYVWGANKCWQLGIANRRHNVGEPVSPEPPDPSLPDIDYTDLALSRSGPTVVNPEDTLTYVGGQLQILPCNSDTGDRVGPKPVQTIRCGREATVVY